MTCDYIIPHSRPWLTHEDNTAVLLQMNSGNIASGQKVNEFEQAVSSFHGAEYAVAQSSGAAALLLALISMNIGAGDEVIVPNYVCRSVLDAVVTSGAQPVLCDVNDEGVLNTETVAKTITENTAAIIAVHIFGHICDVQSLKGFNVPIIEDACQSFGLQINGKYAGTLGDVGIFSFHATKCLTTGEGGMLLTNDDDIGTCARSLTTSSSNIANKCFAPMSDVNAALGISQLSRYSLFLQKRKELNSVFRASLNTEIVNTLSKQEDFLFRFVLKSSIPFSKISQFFLKYNVAIRKGVDSLLSDIESGQGVSFPTSNQLIGSVFSIPFYPSLLEQEIEAISNALEHIHEQI